MTRSISLTLPEDTARVLGEMAEATASSELQLVLDAVRSYLDDYSDALLTLQRSSDDSDRTISSNELRDWLKKHEERI